MVKGSQIVIGFKPDEDDLTNFENIKDLNMNTGTQLKDYLFKLVPLTQAF